MSEKKKIVELEKQLCNIVLYYSLCTSLRWQSLQFWRYPDKHAWTHLYGSKSHQKQCCYNHRCRKRSLQCTARCFGKVWSHWDTVQYSSSLYPSPRWLFLPDQEEHHSYATPEGNLRRVSTYGWLRLQKIHVISSYFAKRANKMYTPPFRNVTQPTY